MLDRNNRFIINNYAKQSTFASFLPGISGKRGIPIWCYYVNRGQCVTSFGVQDKDHSIMEFVPAHQAYQNTKRLGFRTFIKLEDNKIYEPFADEQLPTVMHIGMNELVIEETNEELGLQTTVTYFVLPEEALGGLVRKVSVRNLHEKARNITVLDGMPAVIPYGVSLESIKNMCQTAKAWMEVLDVDSHIPFFHVRASMADTAEVKEITGGNYSFARNGKGALLPAIVDAACIFDYDTSLEHPVLFASLEDGDFLAQKQITMNDMPCSFFWNQENTESGEEMALYEIYGQTISKETLHQMVAQSEQTVWFEQKLERAIALTEEVTKAIETKTGHALFDLYCQQTYLDNVLRGGWPVPLGNKLFYLYSRKHGDIERDYNFFKMSPEIYSQGNGNFRDVNQNRRCDVMFAPYVGKDTIHTFYNLIQIDGYNPLGIDRITYCVNSLVSQETLAQEVVEAERADFVMMISQSFTPGSLMKELQQYHYVNDIPVEERLERIVSEAVCDNKSDFIEGYWTDHWTYNLDLIESYLSVYPDREEELFYFDESYTYRKSEETILPRCKRYQKTEKGIRQYHFLEKNPKQESDYLLNHSGEIVHANLMEKLILLCAVKFAALDVYGMGIEMEGGKPGWYDALNGLPGLLGSSMSETYELARMLEFTYSVLQSNPHDVALLTEVAELLEKLEQAIHDNQEELEGKEQLISFWNQINDGKEAYREKTRETVTGEKSMVSAKRLMDILSQMMDVVNRGIEHAIHYGKGICPTYFYYDVIKYHQDKEGIWPEQFRMHLAPDFLEGSVRFMKLTGREGEKEKLYHLIKKSALYDKPLKMYKVNTALNESSLELGRARAFTPGWLENESVWLHMEYKYLLELLKNGMYEEYTEDFRNAAVPFLDANVYGRSLLENSSFIASSANPNEKIHGKGFVARLSGSTAEFLQMWQIMMFGRRPFLAAGETLELCFEPCIPDYLLDETRMVQATFLGKIAVIYHMAEKKCYFPGRYRVVRYEVTKENGEKIEITQERITGELCEQIRQGKVTQIEAWIE
ncbi:MAG: hypothetical protein ACI4CT_04580 [Lachnospiraceae bacterium]